MRTEYRVGGRGYWVAITVICFAVGVTGCRSSRSSKTTKNSAATKAPAAAAATTQEPSAKQVLSHADSALMRVSQLAAENRDATPGASSDLPPFGDRGVTAPQQRMSDVPYLPKPNLTEYGLYEAALGAYNGSRYDEALALFSRIVTTGRPPELVPNAYYWMGESLYAEKRYAESMPYFEYVVRVGPQFKREMSMYKLSRADLHLGNKQGANTWYERLRAEYPRSSHISTLRNLGAR